MSLVGRTGRRAFTLMEVVVTLVVIGLILISVPVYGRIMDRSEQSRTEVELEAVARRVQALAVIGGDDNLMSVDQLEAAVAATDLDAAGAGLVATGSWDVVRDTGGEPLEWRFDMGAGVETAHYDHELPYGTVGFDFATYRPGGYDIDADMTGSGHVLTLVTEDPNGVLVYARVSEQGTDTWTDGCLNAAGVVAAWSCTDLSGGDWPDLQVDISYAGGEGSNTTTTIVEGTTTTAAPTTTAPGPPAAPTFGDEHAFAFGNFALLTLVHKWTVNVNWEPPANTGGAPLTGYRVVSKSEEGTVVDSQVLGPAETSLLLPDIVSTDEIIVTQAPEMTFEVSAINALGESAPAVWSGVVYDGAYVGSRTVDRSSGEFTVNVVVPDTGPGPVVATASIDDVLEATHSNLTVGASTPIVTKTGVPNGFDHKIVVTVENAVDRFYADHPGATVRPGVMITSVEGDYPEGANLGGTTVPTGALRTVTSSGLMPGTDDTLSGWAYDPDAGTNPIGVTPIIEIVRGSNEYRTFIRSETRLAAGSRLANQLAPASWYNLGAYGAYHRFDLTVDLAQLPGTSKPKAGDQYRWCVEFQNDNGWDYDDEYLDLGMGTIPDPDTFSHVKCSAWKTR